MEDRVKYFFDNIYDKDGEIMDYVRESGWGTDCFEFNTEWFAIMNLNTKTIILNGDNDRVDAEYVVARCYYNILTKFYGGTHRELLSAVVLSDISKADVFAWTWLHTKGADNKIPKNIDKILRPLLLKGGNDE